MIDLIAVFLFPWAIPVTVLPPKPLPPAHVEIVRPQPQRRIYPYYPDCGCGAHLWRYDPEDPDR